MKTGKPKKKENAFHQIQILGSGPHGRALNKKGLDRSPSFLPDRLERGRNFQTFLVESVTPALSSAHICFLSTLWIVALKKYFLSFHGSSCCVGGLAKSHSTSDRTSRTPLKRNIGQSSQRKRRQWSSSPEVMENNVSMSHSLDTRLTSGPPVIEENKSTEENVKADSFVNHAAIAWNQRRKEWVGDQSKRPHRVTREPTISWCTTYEDLLSTNQPFTQPIQLSEMVDFLVDIWHEEGLYD